MTRVVSAVRLAANQMRRFATAVKSPTAAKVVADIVDYKSYLPLPTEVRIKAARRQQAILGPLAHEDFRVGRSIDIIDSSQRNMERLTRELGTLASAEEELKRIIIDNLTAKHATHFIDGLVEHGEIMALRLLWRKRDMVIYNRNTPLDAETDCVFLVTGVGRHEPPGFLASGQKKHVITIKLKDFFKKYPDILRYAFIGGHLLEYRDGSVHSVNLGDRSFQFSHGRNTKTYTYGFGEKKFSRTMLMEDEFFCGPEILDGMALQFIQHLRLIGGSYAEHLLRVATDEDLSEEEKSEIISAGVDHITPGSITCELRIPGKFPLLNIPEIIIEPARFRRRPTKDLTAELKDAVKERRQRDLERILKSSAANPVDPMIRVLPNPHAIFRDTKSALVIACQGGNKEALKALIAAGAEVTRYPQLLEILADFPEDYPEERKKDRLEMYKMLLEIGVKPHEPKYGKTALMMFLERGDIENAKATIAHYEEEMGERPVINSRFHYYHRIGDYPADTDHQHNGYTALHFLLISKSPAYEGVAGKRLRKEMAEVLLMNGCGAGLRSERGDTPYSLALANGHGEIAEMIARILKEQGVNPEVGLQKDVSEICEKRHHRIVAMVDLIDERDGKRKVVLGRELGPSGAIEKQYRFPGATWDDREQTMIGAAVEILRRKTGMDLRKLVESEIIHPEIFYRCGVLSEDKETYYDTIFVRFNAGKIAVKLQGRDDTIVAKAVPFDEVRGGIVRSEVDNPMRNISAIVLEALREERPLDAEEEKRVGDLIYIARDGEAQLLRAVQKNDIIKVNRLLAKGVPADPRNLIDTSPLLVAAAKGQLGIVKALVEHGALVTQKCYLSGQGNVLSAAVRSGDPEVFEYLWPLVLANHNETPRNKVRALPIKEILRDVLQVAIEKRDMALVRRVVDQNQVDLNDEGVLFPPLLLAVTSGNHELVEYFLAQGADPNVGCEGLSTLVAAIESKDKKMVRILTDHPKIKPDRHTNPEGKSPWDVAKVSGITLEGEDPKIHFPRMRKLIASQKEKKDSGRE